MYRIGKPEADAVAEVIASRDLFKCNDGLQETKHCEAELADKFSVEHAVLMTSGTAALTSALVGMGVGPGDEVIVPGYTYIATAMAVTAAGAVPVICEVNDTLTMDPDDVRKKITSHTKAIIPVHIQGFPCDMDGLCALAKEEGIGVLEDACQADGGSFHGRRLGTIGNAGALSFNQFKIISAGEGGALLTNERKLYERAFIYHDSSAITFFGGQMDNVEEASFCGTEFRTNEITAAILRVQLRRLDGILADLRKNKKAVCGALSGKYDFARSNDAQGDCGTAAPFRFDTEAQARAFAAGTSVGGYLPIDMAKHVYTYWTCILNKRGSCDEKRDIFRFPANIGLGQDYKADMCPRSLDLLARTVYVNIDPDWTEDDVGRVVDDCLRFAAKA